MQCPTALKEACWTWSNCGSVGEMAQFELISKENKPAHTHGHAADCGRGWAPPHLFNHRLVRCCWKASMGQLILECVVLPSSKGQIQSLSNLQTLHFQIFHVRFQRQTDLHQHWEFNNTLICCLPQGFLMISDSLLHRFYRPPSSQASCSLTRQWSFFLMDNIHERNHEFYESWGKNVPWKKLLEKLTVGQAKSSKLLLFLGCAIV